MSRYQEPPRQPLDTSGLDRVLSDWKLSTATMVAGAAAVAITAEVVLPRVKDAFTDAFLKPLGYKGESHAKPNPAEKGLDDSIRFDGDFSSEMRDFATPVPSEQEAPLPSLDEIAPKKK